MKKIITWMIVILCLLLALAFGIYKYLDNQTKFNDGYVNGNTAGNLYNYGQFCEIDGIVYFSNALDNNKLYSMKVNGSDIRKISDDSVAFINADKNYVYYVRTSRSKDFTAFSFLSINTNSLCRIRRDKKDSEIILDNAPSLYASLVGNYIYYLHYDKETATTLYRIKIDGTEEKQIHKTPYFTCATNGQYIYYNGLETDHNIYRFNTVNGSQQLLYEGNCWMPTVDGSAAYFMDCDNNYKLAKVDLATGEKTILCEDRVDCYNLFNGYLYFQRSTDDPALCRIRTDGSDYEVLRSGTYTQINTTSSYIYFKDYFSNTMYRMPASGGPLEVFQPSP